MRPTSHNAFGLGRGSVTHNDLFALFVLLLVSAMIFMTWLFPETGVHCMEAGFPLLTLWIGYRGRNEPFAPAVSFPMVYLLWYWLGSIPLVTSITQTTSLLVDFNPMQWTLYAVGFLGLWCGLHLIRAEISDTGLMRRAEVNWDEGLLFLILLLSAVLLFAAWAVIVSKDGITILQADVEQERVNLGTGNHIAFQIFMVAKLIFPLIFLYLWTARKPKLRIPLYVLGTITILALVSTGNRSMAFPPLLTVFALRQYLRKPYKMWHLVVFALIAIPAISVAGYYRTLQHDGPTHVRDLAEMGFPVEVQPFTDFYLYVRAPLDTLRNVVHQIPANTPFQYGRLSFGFVTQLLPGRHPSSDFFFKDLLGHDFLGLGEPASILGPFYADFGLTGVFLGMFFAGFVSKSLYVKMFRGSVITALLYCYFWQVLVASVYGSLITYVIEVLIPIAWIMIYWLIANKVSYRRAERGSLASPERSWKPVTS